MTISDDASLNETSHSSDMDFACMLERNRFRAVDDELSLVPPGHNEDWFVIVFSVLLHQCSCHSQHHRSQWHSGLILSLMEANKFCSLKIIVTYNWFEKKSLILLKHCVFKFLWF